MVQQPEQPPEQVITGLCSREDGRPVILVGVSRLAFGGLINRTYTIDLRTMITKGNHDLRDAEIIIIACETNDDILEHLRPIMGAATKVVYGGQEPQGSA